MKLPRLLVAAPASGGGKTTLTCALLKAFQNRGLVPAAFKCGPDYIDPMFHREVVGAESTNLDLFFTGPDTVRGLLARHGAGADIALLEGVMGYYDGVSGGDTASSWHLARETRSPVLLCVDPKGASLTLAAILGGILAFREEHRVGAILLNRCGEGLYNHLKPILERETGLPVAGFLSHLPQAVIASRHLGLVTAGEIADLQEKIGLLAQALEDHVDLDLLLRLAAEAPPLEGQLPPVEPVTDQKPVIAVARDRAFCFYYRDNLALLEALGARLAWFSPLGDERLPPGARGLYLGGGYPELYAEALAANGAMRRAVREAVAGGMPTLAECGGFQYLQRELRDPAGKAHPMAGVIDSSSSAAAGSGRFGYVTLTARRDNLLCGAGEEIRGHEFHRWDSRVTGDAATATKPDGRTWPCVVATGSLWAGYPHLYFYSNVKFAANLVRAAGRF